MTLPAAVSKNTASIARITGILKVLSTKATNIIAIAPIIAFPGLIISTYGFIISPHELDFSVI